MAANPYRRHAWLEDYLTLMRALAPLAVKEHFLLLTGEGQDEQAGALPPNVELLAVPRLHRRGGCPLLFDAMTLPSIIRDQRIDVLHTSHVAPLAVRCRLVATMRTLHAYTVPALLPRGVRVARRLATRCAVRRADLVIAPTRAARRDIAELFGVETSRLRVVPGAVDCEVYHPAGDRVQLVKVLDRLGVKSPYVLCVSSLWRYKNVEDLIQAFSVVRRYYPDFKLLVIGYGADAAYRAALGDRAADLGLTGSISFREAVDRDAMPWIYRGAQMLVYPSEDETFAAPIIEAMASGCPVIATGVPSLVEIADGCAVHYPARDLDALTKCMLDLIREDDRARFIARSGVARAKDFSWRNAAELTLAAYRFAAAG